MMKYTYPPVMTLSVCLVTSVLAGEAAALTSEQLEAYDALVQEAVDHYSARRYEEAITQFKAAFGIQSEPELLYNIARCYERLAKSEEALVWYQKFLDAPGTTGELRTRALTNIAALKREIAAKEAVEQAGEGQGGSNGKSGGAPGEHDMGTEGAGGGGPAMEDGTGATSSADASKEMSEAPGAKGSLRRLKVIGLTLLGVGVAGMISGSVFGGLALASQNDYDDAGFDSDRIGYRDDMMRNALIFDVVFSTGAVLSAAGGSLLVVHTLKRRAGRETALGEAPESKRYGRHRSVHLTPTFLVGNGQFAGGLAGCF